MKPMRFLAPVGAVASMLLGMGAIAPSFAAPNPVFQDILIPAREQLPEGLKLRLPATIPDGGVQLYPFVKAKSNNIQIYLSDDPECDRPNCAVGGVALMNAERLAVWEQKNAEGTPVSLPQNITGLYFAFPEGNSGSHYISWEQDGTGYVVASVLEPVSRSQLEAVVASMINEAPLP